MRALTPSLSHLRRARGYYFLVLLLTKAAFAADIQISASLDRPQIATNEQAVLSVTMSGNVSNLPEPQMPGLPSFQVSNAGSSQSYTWVNGQASASVTHNYVLTPTQEGHFTIPPVRLTVEGKVIETAPLTLDVVKGNAAALPPPDASSPNPTNAAAQHAPIAFVQSGVDKSSAYVGEAVTFNFRLYNRAAFLRQPQYQPPDTSGFWAEDLPPQRNFNESVKGVPYQVVEVKTALFPIHPGKATVGPGTLNVAIQNFSSDPFGGDVFSNFFSGGQIKTLRSDPITIQVKALPTPEPADFHGAVGEYTISANLDKTSTKVGQPITLSITIAGQGNIKSLPNVSLPPLVNFRTFDANAATNIDKKNYHVQGSKVFKTVLIPTASGTLNIPSIPFVYFDPVARAYKTLKSKALEVRVQAAPPGSTPAPLMGASAASGVPAPGIKVLNEDIRYIKTPASLANRGRPLYRSLWFLAINGLAFLILIISGTIPVYERVFLSNPARQRFREAKKEAGSLLKTTEAALVRSDVTQAGSSLSRALQVYVAAKLGLEESGVSLRAATESLQERRIPTVTIEKMKQLWNTLDLFQFAPAQARAEDIRQSAGELKELIVSLEKEIQWRA